MNQQSIHDRIMSRNQGKDAVRVGIEDRSRPQRNRARTAVFSLLAIAVVATAGFAAMRYDLLHNLLPQPAVAETNQPNPALAETPFLQHAKEAGLQSCSNIFPALGQMLTTGTTYSVQSIWNNEARQTPRGSPGRHELRHTGLQRPGGRPGVRGTHRIRLRRYDGQGGAIRGQLRRCSGPASERQQARQQSWTNQRL